MKNFNKSSILISVMSISILLIVISLIYAHSLNKKAENTLLDNKIDMVEVFEETINKDEIIDFKQSDWEKNYSINKNYMGQLIFESKIINEPIVKGLTNDTYLRTDWKTNKYTIIGTCFMDSNNTLNDENIIIYGHHADIGFSDYDGYVDGDRPMFSYLDLLLSKENYDANSVAYLCLKDEIRTYKVSNVFYCPLSKDDNGEYTYVKEGYEYYLPNYSTEEFKKYYDTLKRETIYNTGIELDDNDEILTLQTCVSGRADLREIVVMKYIGSTEY